MEPLSQKRRFRFLLLWIFIFIIGVPVLVLYTTGYRFGEGIISKTGGISVYLCPSGSTLKVNGEDFDTLGILSRSFFVQDLKKGPYEIEVTKSGYVPWNKTVSVFPQMVSENYAFLVPEKFVLKEIERFESSNSGEKSTSTSAVTKTASTTEDYKDAEVLFAPKKLTKAEEALEKEEKDKILERFGLKASEDILVSGKLSISENKNIVAVNWVGSVSDAPYFLRISTTTVATSSVIFRSQSDISNIEFYPDRTDAILLETPEGIFALQLNIGSKPIDLRPVVKEAGAKLRVAPNGAYMVKIGKDKFYRLELP